jgi:hypothetical protein
MPIGREVKPNRQHTFPIDSTQAYLWLGLRAVVIMRYCSPKLLLLKGHRVRCSSPSTIPTWANLRPGLKRFSFEGLGELYATMARVYQLAATGLKKAHCKNLIWHRKRVFEL